MISRSRMARKVSFVLLIFLPAPPTCFQTCKSPFQGSLTVPWRVQAPCYAAWNTKQRHESRDKSFRAPEVDESQHR
ncbi:uncharacterized protein BCR38DRAFT_441116 [Pseudomassariella vexata]|uniref:Secreted protein n=1 Tax=Pseudomassariella vexata TaxID=1141098 RepID=A0A1Y2DR65_9PEZI|nr:uncharacterized protein BCR38DRAFT_441116 [Pseudomassariella vexata]ORY61783.1 hypothetical protein BCR38DRAFT_441116 [Pseudomassariella vexata]